jgi:hypothetical protein
VRAISLRVIPTKNGYVVRLIDKARDAWTGTDVVANGSLKQILADLREVIPAETAKDPEPVEEPDPGFSQ